MTQKVEFYFDFLSPYSYFAWMRLQKLKEEINFEVDIYPILLAGVLNHWGQKGPAEIDPKREYLFRQCLRYSAKNNLPFTVPQTHPFNPLYALRLALKENAGPLQEEVINCLWKAGWQSRIDMGEPEQLTEALNKANLPGDELLEKTFQREIKQALKKNTKMAIDKGIFGIPSFVINEELFWGNDSIEDMKSLLEGRDLLDKEKYQDLLNRTAKAARQQL